MTEGKKQTCREASDSAKCCASSEPDAGGFFNNPVVHFYRNVFSKVPRPKMDEVARMLKAIHAQEDLKTAQAKAKDVITKLTEMKLRDAAEIVRKGVADTFAFYAFPSTIGDRFAPITHSSESFAKFAGERA